MRYTRKVVKERFKWFKETVPAPRDEHWLLEISNPDPGNEPYRIGLYTGRNDRQGGYGDPLGFQGRAWLGWKEAARGLNDLVRLAEYLRRQVAS